MVPFDRVHAQGDGAPVPRVSVAIPCFNESAVLPECYRRVSAACQSVTRDYEIVFVNDGSSDATWDILRSLVEADQRAALSFCHGEHPVGPPVAGKSTAVGLIAAQWFR